jgi:hypothetical protein
MMLRLANDEVFATGVCPYDDHHPKDPPIYSRIVIAIGIGAVSTAAAVDTGGAFLILDPELAGEMPSEFDPVERHKVYFRGSELWGTLSRCWITLMATAGSSHSVQVTAFIPDWDGVQPWLHPSMLGLSGCLEAFRFAVDPQTNSFYFGPLFAEPSQ